MLKFSLIISLLFAINSVTSAIDYYVDQSSLGNDLNNGTSLSTPFKTIQKAASMAVAGDIVYIRTGTYRETVIPAKSGTAGFPITFQAYNNEIVTISGTEFVTGWSLHSGNIYKAAMPGNFMTTVHNQSDQIFVDGTMMSIARWPNNTSFDPSYPAKSMITGFVSKTSLGNLTTGVVKDTKLPANDYTGAEIYFQPNYEGWSWVFTGTVTGVSGSVITFTSFNGSGQDGNGAIYNGRSRYYIFNKLSLLDTEGEWFHDKTANLLYIWCPRNENPAAKNIEAKKREYAFNLSNRSYITIKQINIFACSITTDDASGGSNLGFDALGNTIYPWRGAGSVAISKNCIIDCVNGKYLSHYTDCSGHFYLQWGQSSGMVISGTDHLIQNCKLQYSAGNGITLLGRRNKVLNNYISDVDYNATDCSAICTGGATATEDHEIGFNTITRTGRSGITPRSLCNSNISNLVARVHHNDISNFMLQDWDGGGIYAAHNGKMLRVDHNTIHDATGYTVSGIYFDWSKNIVIDHNAVWNVEWAIHPQGDDGGQSNQIIYNNTLVVYATTYNGWGPFNIGNSTGTSAGCLIQNNILVYRKGNVTTKSSGYAPFSPIITSTSVFLTNLLHPADPLFVDFANGNLQLQAGSPAINAGSFMTSQLRDGITVPGYNDAYIDTLDIGAYEYGMPAFETGWNTLQVCPSVTTAINPAPEKKYSEVKFYPNPANNEIFFSGDLVKGASLIIRNITGAIIQKKVISQNSASISDLKPGIYLLSLRNGSDFFTQKFVKE
jgi:hypothetical protein